VPLTSINPTTGEILGTYKEDAEVEIERKLALAERTFPAFRHLSFRERAGWMARAAEILESGQDRFGRLMTLEMGKTLGSARAEAIKCAAACRYYAANAEGLLADEPVETSPARSYIRYQPLGPVLAIMPWNFPFWQVFRFAAPALMAGNVGLLKHASNVPQCALAIESIFREAGFPEGAFQTLLIGSGETARVIGDERVKAVTLTGSEPAGGQVAAQAGKLIKKTLLELGGSDPFIVMPSADLEAAVKTAVAARTINNGQSCIAAKRFLIAEPVAAEFERRFVAAMEALRAGDPLEETTALGPLATPAILEGLDRQVRESVAAGARVLTGGRRLDRPGNFYAPTVLASIPETAPAFREEMFGPVAQLYRFPSIDEAIRIANATPFGLGASVWTNDEAERARFIDEIEAGMVYVNAMVASDPRLPFGGVKRSGYGRELGAPGIREFVNVKTVWINAGGRGHRHRTE
jgi:succinate-semialdehyde dehydrogenase / glutarate-semialdehyde dehydrogenase